MSLPKHLKNYHLPVEIPKIFLDETHQQLMNDLRRAGYAGNELIRPAKNFNDLLEPLEDLLSSLHANEPELFHQIFYLIDLPEEIVRSFHQAEISISDLAKIILYRELKKVDHRHRFSKKK